MTDRFSSKSAHGRNGRARKPGNPNARPTTARPKSARQVALTLLGAVMDKHLAVDDACFGNRDFADLSDRDKSFAKLLVLTVARHMGQMNALIDRLLQEPPEGDKGQVRRILQLGLAQLVYLKTPAHAAVGQTVELAGRKPLFRYKGVVNAILRRVDREGDALFDDLSDPKLNVRPWAWKSWEAAYGETTARAIATAHVAGATLDLTVKDDADDWAETLGADRLPTGSLRLPAGTAVPGLEGYKAGHWWVQDAAAALPVKLLGDVTGKTVIDLCAAPGGKTMQLIAAGASVTAVDRHGGRLKRLQANLDRVGQRAQVVEADAETWRPEKPADIVLLDAPCTATGTIRRHPELQWIRSPNDVKELAELQRKLLLASLDMVRPGGEILYVTCSLQPEEGEAQIAGLLDAVVELSLKPFVKADLPGLEEAITDHGYLRCLPSYWAEKGGMDGFFAARLIRK
ncbi:RsmB/NOP family class I SAM-dependent RNA methyltransferase [Aestuariispira insulae]|uniref:16S rRNA (Cytosine967-C5)-methyltransferase n=1 Tax=Aestuariispira insulae TaxID=1461337 RepID=A0A3D9HFA1_9PROT|nr:RsmB/NOP family class I SAM-dependent RNA methyltransferase [Aestuariispira insulae]RED48125.1 16S rRNA (cytosine967-C5)-methyltransferase [Aestuariispira insulae]